MLLLSPPSDFCFLGPVSTSPDHTELFCMGFSFAAFLFFILITRTTELDYDSKSGGGSRLSVFSHDVQHFMLFTAVCVFLCAVRLTLSAVLGVVGGIILVMIWWRFGSVVAVVVIVVGLMLGFLLASVVLFTPLGTE